MGSAVDQVPVVAEKPYLTEENGEWSVIVPPIRKNVPGGTHRGISGSVTISMEDVFVAKEGDNETTITAGIQGGLIFFFQSELPYHDPKFWNYGYVGYRVGYGVRRHTAYGVGIYQVFPTYSLDAGIRVPATAQLTNAFAWSITTGSNRTLGKLLCSAPGTEQCHEGVCDTNSCHLKHFPVSTESGKAIEVAVSAESLVV